MWIESLRPEGGLILPGRFILPFHEEVVYIFAVESGGAEEVLGDDGDVNRLFAFESSNSV